MGDDRRGTLFAQFVAKQYPRAKSVLCVADGKGAVARALANKGYAVRVVDPKPRWAGREHKQVRYERGTFTRESAITEDVVVAMHPDEATIEVLLAARKQSKPFAIVPCCRKALNPSEIPCGGWHEWLAYLKRLAGETLEYTLKMTGKNIVLWHR